MATGNAGTPSALNVEEYLATIPSETHLFDVYAMDMPEELGGTESLIAQVWSDSKPVTSRWGDENMFFRH